MVTLVWPGFNALALRDMQAPEGRAAGSVKCVCRKCVYKMFNLCH